MSAHPVVKQVPPPEPSPWNLPNALTVLRILLVPVFAYFLLREGGDDVVPDAIERIVDNLGQVNPTFMAGAPRIFEKVRVITTFSASSASSSPAE